MSSQELHIALDKVLDFIIKDNKGNCATALYAFINCSHIYKELNKQKETMDINNERDKMQLQKIELDFKIAIHDLNNFIN
jgi:hypothetical protein